MMRAKSSIQYQSINIGISKEDRASINGSMYTKRPPGCSVASRTHEVAASERSVKSAAAAVAVIVAGVGAALALGIADGSHSTLAEGSKGAKLTCKASGTKSSESSFVVENAAAMNKMMVAMTVRPTGDVDADFVAMMIPHHQGAIDMAEAALRYGHNEQVRRLAQEIIVTQQEEIAAMRLAVGQPLPPSRPAPTQSAVAESSAPQPHVASRVLNSKSSIAGGAQTP